MAYAPKSLKRDPDTGAVAIRTQFSEEGPQAKMAWLVATHNRGADNATTADLAGWDDIYTPDDDTAKGQV